MTERTVWTFFYGSNINLEILKRVDYVPERVEVARLHGFDIAISPLANLVPSEQDVVYGILATGTHGDLDRLYGRYVQDELGALYLPEAVLCETLDGRLIPALCYIAPPTDKTQAAPDDYLDRIIKPAREFGFPDWYIDRLERFRG
ncbi:MAG: gamma-glutamylcyclotransferase family protein [Alphaproteobacteria bacterium]|nr:gamma-glutamylcyclotransferase family protein [Alphaproteobacteria bacterium]